MKYIKRDIEAVIEEVSRSYPAMIVTGLIVCTKQTLSAIDKSALIVPLWAM